MKPKQLLVLTAIQQLQPTNKTQLAQFLGWPTSTLCYYLYGFYGEKYHYLGLIGLGYVNSHQGQNTMHLTPKGCLACEGLTIVRVDGKIEARRVELK